VTYGEGLRYRLEFRPDTGRYRVRRIGERMPIALDVSLAESVELIRRDVARRARKQQQEDA